MQRQSLRTGLSFSGLWNLLSAGNRRTWCKDGCFFSEKSLGLYGLEKTWNVNEQLLPYLHFRSVTFLGADLLCRELGAALLHGTARQQAGHRSWTHYEVVWETSRNFHGKRNCCWHSIFYSAYGVFLKVYGRLFILHTDESWFVVVVADVRVWGQRRIWDEVFVVLLYHHSIGHCRGRAWLVFGVVEWHPVFLLWLGRGDQGGLGGLGGRLRTRGGNVGQGRRATPFPFVGAVTYVHVALTAALCFTAQRQRQMLLFKPQ